MKVTFMGAFRRDLLKIRDRHVKKSVLDAIVNVKGATNTSQIFKLVKLRRYRIHYRIEVESNYRIGLIIRGSQVWFVRVLHRSKIYRKFP
jgi:mRNA-degrading endonuclease RelE of RelBE toxin-antitoxin system